MTAADRRRAILEALSSDKFTTRANLAFEFGVSKRTIDHDLLLLSQKYPIYAISGKGGGIHIMGNFQLDGRYPTEEQTEVLVRLTEEVSESDSRVLRSILKKFGKKSDCVAKSTAVGLAEKYNAAIGSVPPRLYDLYLSLYIGNNTQALLAEKWGYSEGHIRNLNRQLYAFFQGAFEKTDKGGDEHENGR